MKRQAEYDNATMLNLHDTHGLGRQCLVQGDGETSLLNNGNKDDQTNQCSEAHAKGLRVFKKLQRDIKNENSKLLQEQLDMVALYLFPVIFIVFNLFYWPYYLILIHW